MIEELDKATSYMMTDQAFDLLALSLVRSARQHATMPSKRFTAILCLRSVIQHHLHDSELKPMNAAALAGMSVRYANRSLAAAENTSLARFILSLRLECCRRALEDPLQAQKTASEIAFAWGFNSVAYFSRVFRARFGSSPRDYRHNTPLRSS